MSENYEEMLWRHLSLEGIAVPLNVILKWNETQKAAAEHYADSLLTRRTFGFASRSTMPECLRPYIERKDKPYDGHGLA
ncbi:MAG TPA: hypothetical protein VJ044_14975 [Candidatus Hodarchaeales archaeon]|nr:hypothetical protein [Candidatus Hodarchaeales archaeon]